MTQSKIVTDYEDINFTVIATLRDEYYCDFAVYELVGVCTDGTRLWLRAGENRSYEHVSTIEEAKVYLHGHIKWDGCSDWHFDEQDSVMLHFCGLGNFRKVNDLFTRMYKQASELIPASEIAVE